MKVITTGQTAAGEERVYVRAVTTAALPRAGALELHDRALTLLRRHGVKALRAALGLVFLWFGVLKLVDSSPVMELLKHTYSFLPLKPFAAALGVWEVLVGVGLLSGRALRWALVLMCLHMAGTFGAMLLSPSLFFHGGNPLWLTVEGEFVIKNLVLVAAGLVIAGHELRPLAVRGEAGAYPVSLEGREEESLAS
jgi:putative oxidoreductase